MDGPTKSSSDYWRRHIEYATPAYRILSFAIGIGQTMAFPQAFVVPDHILLCGIGFYVLVTTLYPFRLRQRGTMAYTVLCLDILTGVFLMILTAGLHSPFLLFTLTPVVTAALFMHTPVAAAVAALSLAYVAASQLHNPFYNLQVSFTEISYFFAYMMSAGLVATLPYLTNVNFMQQMQADDMLGERHRLSREIHDGVAQTVSALRWQVQLVQRRLQDVGMSNLEEVKELEMLADKAQYEARESLEMLRSDTGNGHFLPNLRSHLVRLKAETGINSRVEAGSDGVHLEPLVEVQLLRICQEALTNIRRHSKAQNVRVEIKPVNGSLKVSIADDGRGFDIIPFYHGEAVSRGQGLAVMRERAQSVGGKFRALSLPGHGTEIQVEVPVNGKRSRR